MPELDERVAREKAAHDEGSVREDSRRLHDRFYHVFRCPNSKWAERYFDASVVKYAKDRDILDYGCHGGWATPRYLEMGPRSITGLDISETAIALANEQFGQFGKFYVGDAHRMPFADESFDLAAGRGILHHLDLNLALKEIQRVLRPGGAAIFIEPLADNPGAKLLRALTPKFRTQDEKALSRASILWADSLFGGSSHLFYNLASVPAGMLTSFTPLSPDNFLLRLTDIPDRMIAQTPLKYWMRNVVLVWLKA
ncbi:MAG: class I SAM-dependent methyltransferase [Terracidiphilus sp.]